ncbi:MAG: phage tail baseplate protein [Rhizomicrobium sp.]
MVTQVSASGGGFDPNVDPGSVNPPAIFEPSTALTNGSPQVWVAASGGANWGGCLVSLSFDGTNYDYIGTITAGAYQGTLTASLAAASGLDTTDTLSIDLTESAGVLPTAATDADADAFRTLCYLSAAYTTAPPGTGELLAYGAVSATGTYTNDLSYLQRGLYGTTGSAFSPGDFFTRIDLGELDTPPNSVVTTTLPVKYIGATLYLKLQSFNTFGNALEDISTVTEYTYAPSGVGYGGGTGGVPTTPTGFSASVLAHAIGMNWTANPAGDNVTGYTVQRELGTQTGQPTGGSTVFTGVATAAQDAPQFDNATFTYWVAAINAAGTGLYSTPVTIVTGANFTT